MKWDKLCELARELPGVTVEKWWGTPGFKVRGGAMFRTPLVGGSVRLRTVSWSP